MDFFKKIFEKILILLDFFKWHIQVEKVQEKLKKISTSSNCNHLLNHAIDLESPHSVNNEVE